jgi:hypothetical protein
MMRYLIIVAPSGWPELGRLTWTACANHRRALNFDR